MLRLHFQWEEEQRRRKDTHLIIGSTLRDSISESSVLCTWSSMSIGPYLALSKHGLEMVFNCIPILHGQFIFLAIIS